MADLTQRVIDERPDLRNAPDNSGSIPLHFAASAGVEGVTTLLLGEGINKADGNGMRPIHVAASVGAMDVVRALLDGDNHPTPRDNRAGHSSMSPLRTRRQTWSSSCAETRRLPTFLI